MRDAEVVEAKREQIVAATGPAKLAARFPTLVRAAFHTPYPVVLLGLLAFIPSIKGYFLSDDFVLLDWTHEVSLSGVGGFFDPNTFWFYRPLVKVYYWLGQSVVGLHPEPFHIVSILLHGANACLVFVVVAGRHGTRWKAGLAAALIFLWMPYSAETVSWIAATGDLAATFCILAVLLLMRHYWRSGGVVYLAASLGLFMLGLFTRETTVLLLPLLILDVLVFKRAPRLGRAVAALVYFVVPLGIYLLIQSSGGTSQPGRGGLAFRNLNIESILLGVTEYAHGLLPGGGLLAQLSLETLRTVVWVELAVVLAVAFLLWKARQHTALLGLSWMLLTPLIFVFFSAPTDRYFYLPSVGYAIFIASLIARLPAFIRRHLSGTPQTVRAAAPVAALLVLALLASEVAGLLRKESAWHTAGQTSMHVFEDTERAAPEPNDYAAFFYIDLPATIEDVPTFGNGMQQAVQLLYGNKTIAASITDCSQLQAQQETPRYSYFLRYNGNGVDALPNKEACR
ncbi:MAG: hypothetical protein ABI670_15190 [Chloroflexota bacterium]